MPCHAAITDRVVKFSPDTVVEKALKELQKKNVDHAAVVNEKGVIEGIFSIDTLIKNLLPVSLAGGEGLQLDITVRAAPGIAKRLKKVYPLAVSEVMERKFNVVYPETPIWEGINYLVNNGAPLAVVEGENNKFIGMMTSTSALEELQRLQESES